MIKNRNTEKYVDNLLLLAVNFTSVLIFIVNKVLKMKKSSGMNASTGKVINLLSFDTHRFDTAVSLLHHLWKGPIEVLVFGYFLYNELGYYGWIGIAFIVCFVPIQSE